MELTPQQVLELARKWQFDPVAEKQDLDQEDNKKIPVLRNDELARIQEITKLDVSQTDFNHAFGWIVAEGKILDFIEKEFQNQSNPELLEQLKREKDLADNKKTVWEKHHQKNQERFAARTNEEEIQKFTDRDFVNELKPEQPQPMGGKREIPRDFSPASQPLSQTKVLTKVQVGVSGNNWRTYFIHPEQYFGKVFSSFKNSLARVFGQKTTGAVTAGVAKQAAAGVAKKGLGALAKKGAASLAAKIGLGAATGGVGTAVLMAAEKLWNKIPPEWKNKLKDLWSMMQIGAAGVIGWLLMNLGALAGGIIGGIIGASAGALIAPFLGPLAPLAPVIGSSLGFTVGAFVGYSLQGIASSILGLGGGSTAGGISAGAVPAAAPSISFAGLTLPGSISAAASSFGALLSGSGLSTIALFGVGGGISLISIFTALTIIAVGATQPPEQPPTNEGSLFSVEKTVDNAKLPNNSSNVITFSVTFAAGEDIEITKVTDELTQENKTGSKKFTTSSVVWPTKLNKGGTQKVSIPYQISGASYNDSNLVNVVEVTAKSGSKMETLTTRAMVTIGNPDYTTDRCQLGLENGYCAVSKLLQYFGNQAENASRICVAESEGMKNPSRLGKPNTINNSCAKNLSPEKMREYSVGLFQINLWGHDNFCKEILGGQTPFRKPYYAKCTYPDCTPCDRDEDLLQQCKDYWIQPEHNYEAAKRLFDGRKGSWVDWSVAKPQYCNIP